MAAAVYRLELSTNLREVAQCLESLLLVERDTMLNRCLNTICRCEIWKLVLKDQRWRLPEYILF